MDKAISIDKHDRNQHSVYLLYYHLILVVKYRRKVFDDSISERAKEIFCYIAKGYDITLEEWNHDEDHVHVMFRAKPATQISKFINAYKSASSRLLKKEFPQIRSRLWKEYFWSRSFCLLTAGGAPVEVIREYIESQGKGGRNGKSYKAYRFRLYPNKQQEQQFARTFGCCRFLYNHMLADKIEFYRRTGGMLKNRPADYKKEFPWLKEVDSMALCNVQMHLESAYRKFFTEPKTGFPKFHSKHHGTASYTTNVINGNIRLVSGRLKLPKMAPLKIILHRDVPTKARLKSVTVTREASGKYYASLLYEQENCENQTVLPVRADKVLGIDFAMAGLAVFSDGTKAEYPMYYRRGEQRLARAQRKLSRCKKGSRNYEKQKRRVAICHEKIRNQRADFQNKLIYRIVVSYDAVCVENLDMKAMSRGLHFGKSVMDNANGRFRRRLEEKMVEMGKTFIKEDRFFPSSKRCSCCGRVKAYLPLNERTYRCECGYVEDRDVNAAINLKMEGIRILGAV